jgi:hypothetical protein
MGRQAMTTRAAAKKSKDDFNITPSSADVSRNGHLSVE